MFQHKLEEPAMESSLDQVPQRHPAPRSLEQRDGKITPMEQIICSCSGALVTSFLSKFIHSFIPDIFIVPLLVHYYSEALPTQHGYCVGVSRRRATGNCERRTCPRSLRDGQSEIRTHDPLDERRKIYQ